MAGIDLPEDIIENIFSRLPVKSLIRFTCVSKKYHLLILKDQDFAKTQYKLSSSGHRLFIPERGSVDLDTPSFEDIRKPNFRFLPPDGSVKLDYTSLLGSCNGLMFVRVQGPEFFVCNPSTGFFKKLSSENFDYGEYSAYSADLHGVGYLSTTDDYKVVANHPVVDKRLSVMAEWVLIFSFRARLWKRMEHPSSSIVGEGTLSNEALHWIDQEELDEMVVLDLANEEFRTRQLPDFDQDVETKHFRRLGVTAGGSLFVLCYPQAACDSLDFWVMREYEVDDSWSKLFNLKLSDPEQHKLFDRVCDCWTSFLFMKSCTIAIGTGKDRIINFLRIDHKRGKLDLCNIEGWYSEFLVRATKYEESLLWIDEAPDDPILLERERAIEERERERAAELKRKKKRRRRSCHRWTIRRKRT